MLSSNHKTIRDILGRDPIHPFPARMAPGIALEALKKHKQPIRVLDPMTGSGTVLAVARNKGHHAIGTDLDPLAVLLAGVWTRTVDSVLVREKSVEILRRAQELFPSISAGTAYPSNSDEETRAFIRYWFDEYARRQLSALSKVISRSHDQDVRDVLWCGFSRLIITKQAGASLAMDLSHSRPHKTFERAPIKPFNKFLTAVETVVANCPNPANGPVGPQTAVRQGDARKLATESNSIDLVLTSPPYLNAIDYMRCSKFSLVWMGYNTSEIRRIRGESVGAEAASSETLNEPWVAQLIKQLGLRPVLSNRDHEILARYVLDMSRAIAEVSRVLKCGGRAIYVVGDSKTKGTFIRNSEIVTMLAEKHGLSFVSRKSRNLPENRRYLPPPKARNKKTIDSRMRQEVIVSFKKP